MPGALGTIRAVLRLPSLRRLIPAFLAFSVAEWASWIGVVVFAYSRGGPAEAGIVAGSCLSRRSSWLRRPRCSAIGGRGRRSSPRRMPSSRSRWRRLRWRSRSLPRSWRTSWRPSPQPASRSSARRTARSFPRSLRSQTSWRSQRGIGNGRRARRTPRPAVGRAADRRGRPGRRLRCQRGAGARRVAAVLPLARGRP